jgi:hypothetical protein
MYMDLIKGFSFARTAANSVGKKYYVQCKVEQWNAFNTWYMGILILHEEFNDKNKKFIHACIYIVIEMVIPAKC